MKKFFKWLGVGMSWLVGIGGLSFLGVTLATTLSCSQSKPQDTSGFSYTKHGNEYVVSWPYFDISNATYGEDGYQEVLCYKDGKEFAKYTSIKNGGVYCNYFEFKGDGYYNVELKTFKKDEGNTNSGVFLARTLAKGYITKENWNGKI